MDSFSSPSSSEPKMSTDDLMHSIQSQLAKVYMEEFYEDSKGKCFDKCITKPGSSLSGGESSCISRCMDRYIEATACSTDEDEKCHFYGFFDDELPSDYYKKLFFNLHEENKMLKKNLGKNMYKNKKKPNNSDEGCILEMGELKDDLTLIKSKLQMYDKVVVVLVILVAFVIASRLFA
ncbi:mitochondrial import inner membrane translocase subunit TIM13 [Tanacetum coccineum]